VVELVKELASYGVRVAVHDPVADREEVEREFALSLSAWDELPRADALVAAVAHRGFVGMSLDRLTSKLTPGGCFIDVKSRFDRRALEAAGFSVWRL